MKPFWKRKQAEAPAAASPHPRRSQHRTRPSEAQGVVAAVHLPSGERIPALIVDISGTGAALRLALEHDPVLARGDVIELSVALPGKDTVKTPGEVVFAEQDGDRHTRYGFRFTNLGNLYSQLDDQYARLFSRRGAQRTAATLEHRIPIRLSWQGIVVDSFIHDISDGGIGVLLTSEEAARFRGAQRAQASFKLDPRGEALEGRLEVVHRHDKGRQKGVLLGLRFVFEEHDGGFGRHAAAIQAFVLERNRHAAGWEGSWRPAI